MPRSELGRGFAGAGAGPRHAALIVTTHTD